jgi:hypothetical protein
VIEKEKLALMNSAEEERLAAELQFLNLTHQQTIDKLRQEINISIATLFFKAEGGSLHLTRTHTHTHLCDPLPPLLRL